MKTLKFFIFYFLGIFNLITALLAWEGIAFSVHFFYNDHWTPFHFIMMAISLIGASAGATFLWTYGCSPESEEMPKPPAKIDPSFDKTI